MPPTPKANQACLTHGLYFGIVSSVAPGSLVYGGDITAFNTHVAIPGTHHTVVVTEYDS